MFTISIIEMPHHFVASVPWELRSRSFSLFDVDMVFGDPHYQHAHGYLEIDLSFYLACVRGLVVITPRGTGKGELCIG